jgi:hypothetical protein
VQERIFVSLEVGSYMFVLNLDVTKLRVAMLTDSQHNNPLLREPSETLREQFVVNNEYK